MTSLVFYRHFDSDPYFNMAFDEWMLAKAAESPNGVILRLYTWHVGTITFGYNQKQETALDFSKIGATPVIRRITGGRALYHDPSELTYSVAMHFADFPAGISISQTSANIAGALRGVLEREGVTADYVRTSHRPNRRPEFFHKSPCFASAARYEFVRGEEKVIASAQRRAGDLILQHGAIKLRGVAPHPALQLNGRGDSASLQPVDSNAFTAHADHFAKAFAEHYGLPIHEATLTGGELSEVRHWADHVKKNALLQRQIIKRNLSFNSL